MRKMSTSLNLFSGQSAFYDFVSGCKLTRKLLAKHVKATIIGILSLMFFIGAPTKSAAQSSPNEAEWNGYGYSLKKVVSNTSIASGVNFSYTILFTAPAGVSTINIEDIVPSSLTVVSVPTPAAVSGVTPVVGISGQTVTYTLSSLPTGVAHSGSFTIVVQFPPGITCPGETARNRAGILVNDKWEYTPYVSTVATAADPWKVSKAILTGAVVNPLGGSCGYQMNEDGTVKYRISVLKNSPYWGNNVGQQNASSAVITDLLPTGATMTTYTTNAGTASQTGSTLSWNIGTLNAATPYAYYYLDVEIYYPVANFPNGSTIYNSATLDAVSCGQPITHDSNQTCIEVADIVQNPSGYFKKYISLTNRVPGCEGYYNIVFCNNGNVPLSAFNIDDVIPSGITVTSLKVYGGDATTTMALTANSGVDVIAPSITTSSFDSGSLGVTVNDVQLQMTGSLPVGDCINLLIYFTVDSNPTGTTITNCATFDELSNSLTLPQTCVSFIVEEGEPVPCLIKDICSPQDSYEPGDIVRFRLRVQNIGSADLIGGVIQDALHSNFTYVGNESYYYSNTYNTACTTGGTIPSGATAWGGVSPSHSGNNLSWNLPDIAADCQAFYVAYCGYYGTYGIPYYYIEFDAVVTDYALPGVTPNEFEVDGGNLTGTYTSNTVNVLVVASFGQEVEKLVSTDNGSTFASSGNIAQGGTARYRLDYKNTSNVPVSSIQLVDLLPLDDGVDDWLILNRAAARGSQFGVTYDNNHSTSLSSGTASPASLTYAAGANICLPAFGVNTLCTTTSWGTTTDQNIKMDYGAFSLNPSISLMEDFDVIVSDTASHQQVACNDFAALVTANFLLDGTPQSVTLTPIAAPQVCLTIDTTLVNESCCDSVIIRQIEGDDCCVEITSTCDVASVEVTINNGTFSSTSWNCGDLPTDFVGQSSYTFTANNCALEMVNCFTADQAGVVSVTYLITFANGETCEQSIELDCATSVCCENTKLEQVEEDCCVRLVTSCEVETIDVTVDNGTISSASWNCGTLPTGFVGQSTFTFDANNCATDMTLCVEAIVSGVVTVTMEITYANGERCEKVIELNCEATSCCDNIIFEQIEGEGCCTVLTTECEVESVEVIVTNGTLSSVSWNCGTLPTDYFGKDNYVFQTNGCAVDMTACVNADQTGVVTVTYIITFANGEKCEKTIETDCEALASECCADVDFKLKSKWPQWNTTLGTFNITNLDPTSPICYVEISSSPAATFTPGTLVVDGVSSTQSWNSTRIPATGNLAPAAINTIKFNMSATGYSGVVEICVVKCDGTVCCFEFKWNKKPWVDIGISVDEANISGKLYAVTVSPVVDSDYTDKVKYVSFGFSDQTEIDTHSPEFFAVSATSIDGDDNPEGVAETTLSHMGKQNVFFELANAKKANESLGNFNLVISNKLPTMGTTLFDEEGNIIFAGEFEVSGGDVNTAIGDIGSAENMFEFISLYPNPTEGLFNITYATGNEDEISIRIINNKGQVITHQETEDNYPGIHKVMLNKQSLTDGVYHVVLQSKDKTISKSFIKK